jgi:hypothetical protein
MREVNLKSWDDFVNEIRVLESDRASKKEKGTYVSELLYRGQADSRWGLHTTLERSISRPVSLNGYYRLIHTAKHRVETFTDGEWQIPSVDEYRNWLTENQDIFYMSFAAYNYFVYLRHYGFPSPLLDWTASPYIAAFFAMNNAKKDVESVSIYAFIESSEGPKVGSLSEPEIHGLGPNVKADRRHFLQQSHYSICTTFKNDKVWYACHQDVADRNNEEQDLLWKFNLPISERPAVLQALNKMNINPFSLFGTVERLMETIANAELLLSDRRLDD